MPSQRSITICHLALYISVLCLVPQSTSAHGRLWEPPGRSTMWRRGFDTPRNDNDHELYCGGFMHQVNQGYKCGVCGDAWDLPDPRPHEANGKYAKGVIARTYKQGENVNFEIDMTANHLGWIGFKICPINDPYKKAEQSCFDQYPVEIQGGSGTRLYIGRTRGKISVPVKLPAGLSCEFCTVQWRYHTGNSWGTAKNGTRCLGCGYQEEFYGCADVKILPNDGTQPRTTKTPELTTKEPQKTTKAPQKTTKAPQKTTKAPQKTNKVPEKTTKAPEKTTKTPGNPKGCRGKVGMEAFNSWCATNCAAGFCPDSHCTCAPKSDTPKRTCKSTGINPNPDAWCVRNCEMGFCPASHCICS